MHPQLNEISIRRAGEAERAALLLLSVLDGGEPLSGEILIAYVDDEPQAAIDIHSGATVTDPFRATAHLVELLRLRAGVLRREWGFERRPWLRRLATRAAEA